MWTIAAKELRILFLSPLAWMALAVAQFLLAWVFLGGLDHYLQNQGKLAAIGSGQGFTAYTVMPLFGAAALVLLFLIPLLCMRMISEERRLQTFPLLLAAPLSRSAIIGGKYVAVLGFLLPIIGLTAAMPLSLLVGGSVDIGHLLAATLGLVLLSVSATAIGMYASTLTAQPALAGAIGGGILLALWHIDWAGSMAGPPNSLFTLLSLQNHFSTFKQGVVDSRSVVYFLAISGAFITWAILRLDDLR